MKQISYIFKNGRLQRLDKDTHYPTEFYYSYLTEHGLNLKM